MKRLLLPLFCLLFFGSCIKHKSQIQKKQNNIFYDRAHEYKDKNISNGAYKYFSKAKDLFLERKDSLGVGKCLLNMAIISTNESDSFSGQELSLDAIRYFNKKNKEHYIYIQSNFNNLGLASEQLARYTEAISFYQQALPFSTNNSATLIVKNNIANGYRRINNYNKAIAIYNEILLQKPNDEIFSKVLSNLAFTKWLQKPNYNAAPNLLKALNIRLKENDLLGQNASYAHLANYYAMNHPDSTLFYAIKMYQVAKKLKSPFDQIQALTKLIEFSPAKSTKQYFERYRELDDSIQIARSTSRNQFALIRYETEKSKADNLILQKENTNKKYQIIKREILLYSSLFVLVVAAIVTSIWYKKRKQQLAFEAQNTIRDNQLNTSKKVHDRVANKIYSVISEVENKKELDKDDLLDKLDHIYHTSRDISYEITDTKLGKKFSQQLFDMLNTYVADPPSVKITGNKDEIWTDVSTNSKGEIFIVLQELMTNMKKHSQATEVNIKFHKKDKLISIRYHDNGIGLPKNVIHNNGLRNTETRIKNISGTLTFETIDKLGLEILISFPVN